MSRLIDKHDVRAFCERAREAIHALEAAASEATGTGWLAEAEDHRLIATQAHGRAVHALDDLLQCLAFTLAEQERHEATAADSLLP